MKTHWKILVFFLCFIPILGFADEHAKGRESCKVCGMYIDRYLKSAAELVYKDGTVEHTCGVACMLRVVDDEGGMSAFKSVKVHDWVSGKLVDAETATYVMGSSVIPDMVPNYIAFAKREEAEDFAAKKGGDVIDFDTAFADVSPVGTTAPFRVRTAVTPGAGNFSVAMIYGYMEKNQIKRGSAGVDPNDFIHGNKYQPKAPQDLQVQQQALAFNYSPLDNLALFLNIPWFERRLTTETQTTPNKNGITTFGESIANTNGIGDIVLEGRYNFWRSTRWDKFATLFLGTTLPTGEFTGTRALDALTKRMLVSQPGGLQLGKGTATFRGGLLYSQRWKDWWFHGSAIYEVNPENSDRYAFGDAASVAVALHYTPNYNLMVGLEMDAIYTEKSTDNGFNIGNTGGTQSNIAFVADYRFLNAFGGNFKLRGSVGLPIYEDLNYKNVVNAAGKPFQQVQLGDGFFANAAIQWTFREAPDY